jgi:hypothetical protein
MGWLRKGQGRTIVPSPISSFGLQFPNKHRHLSVILTDKNLRIERTAFFVLYLSSDSWSQQYFLVQPEGSGASIVLFSQNDVLHDESSSWGPMVRIASRNFEIFLITTR